MADVPHKLQYLNTWSLVSDGGSEVLGHLALMKKVR